MLEMLDIPYTGSGPQNLAYCYDKSLIRGVAHEMEIPVAEAIFIKPEDHLFEVNIPFPVIAKPNLGDSSFGITRDNVVYTIEELDAAIVRIREKFGYSKPILIEEFLIGAEVTVGVIGNPPDNYEVLPIIEEDYSLLPDELPGICGYEAKWLTDSPYFKLLKSKKANLDPKTEQQLISYCVSLFLKDWGAGIIAVSTGALMHTGCQGYWRSTPIRVGAGMDTWLRWLMLPERITRNCYWIS